MRDFENPMRYPVTLTPAVEGGFVVSFPDIPEALTQGNTRHDALQAAQAALITALNSISTTTRRFHSLQRLALKMTT